MSLSYLPLLQAGVVRLQRDRLDLQLLGLPLLLLLPLPLLLFLSPLLLPVLPGGVLSLRVVGLGGLVLLARVAAAAAVAVLDFQAGNDGRLVFGLLVVVPLDEAGPEKLGR